MDFSKPKVLIDQAEYEHLKRGATDSVLFTESEYIEAIAECLQGVYVMEKGISPGTTSPVIEYLKRLLMLKHKMRVEFIPDTSSSSDTVWTPKIQIARIK